MKHAIQNQHGNALWFILLAVALLAFLTGVVSRNSGSIDQAGGVEQARIKASSLLRFGKSVETTVQRMMLNGISENDLDFLAIDADHDNTNCTTAECEVFNVDGGGITYQTPSQIMNESSHTDIWHVSTGNRVYQFGCDTGNNKCSELILLAVNIPKAVCLQINKIQGITNPGNDAPQQFEMGEGGAYTGTFSLVMSPYDIGGTDAVNDSPQAKGKSAGCVFEFGGGQDKYYFYQVLIPR